MIHGLTHQRKRRKPVSQVDFTLHKGHKKIGKIYRNEKTGKDEEKGIVGRDMNECFRIEPKSKQYQNWLLQCEGVEVLPDPTNVYSPHSAKAKGFESLRCEQMRIHLAFRETEKSFDTKMLSMKPGGRLTYVCDRHTILEEVKQEQDSSGNVHNISYESNKNCPVAKKSLSFKCPNDCSAQGTLYFHPADLALKENLVTGSLTTTSQEDIANISEFLEEMLVEYGSVSEYPLQFSLGGKNIEYLLRIPYILRRFRDTQQKPLIQDKKRTGSSYEGIHWELKLEVAPEFRRAISQFNKIQTFAVLGYQPDREQLAALINGNFNIEVAMLPPSTKTPSLERSEQARPVNRTTKPEPPAIEVDVIESPQSTVADIVDFCDEFKISHSLIFEVANQIFDGIYPAFSKESPSGQRLSDLINETQLKQLKLHALHSWSVELQESLQTVRRLKPEELGNNQLVFNNLSSVVKALNNSTRDLEFKVLGKSFKTLKSVRFHIWKNLSQGQKLTLVVHHGDRCFPYIEFGYNEDGEIVEKLVTPQKV